MAGVPVSNTRMGTVGFPNGSVLLAGSRLALYTYSDHRDVGVMSYDVVVRAFSVYRI